MSHGYGQRHVTDEDRRELLKALGVAGAVTVGGATLGEIREEMSGGAATELAPIGEAIKADLAGQLDASLLAAQQSDLVAAASGLSIAIEQGLPQQGPRGEFAAVAEAARPTYDHLAEVGFFESTTAHLPEFTPSYLGKAVSTFVGSEALSGSLEEFEFVGGSSVDVVATAIGNAKQISDLHWVATDQIAREEFEYGKYIPPMTQSAAGGALLWLEDLDQHLWTHEVLLTEDILADAVWHGQAMAAGHQLVVEGAKAIAESNAALSDAELGGVLSTGFAVLAISQALLPADVYWVTEEMRDSRRTDLGRVTIK